MFGSKTYNMNRIILILLLSVLGYGINAQSFLDSHSKKIEKALCKWSADFSGLEHLKNSDNREYYKINLKNKKSKAILVLSSGKGRYDKFDIMTVLTENKIELLKILKYRSQYGSEISNKKWLAQFYQKPGKEFIMRKNIDAISGATFSTQGIVNEVNQILKSLGKINNKS